ncbi:MAG: MBL fold metallo-hydrolase [Planctomycetota bacterium]
MKFGEFGIFPVSDGFFRLDGGAMFGVVPRVLWEKRAPPDAKNRIRMGLWCLLIQAAGKNILVNTGIGNKYTLRFNEIYGIKHPPSLISSLAEHNVKPTDIDMVILTHLHFDHCGGNTVYQDPDAGLAYPRSSPLLPAFPNARYIVQEAEWQRAVNPNERTRASYIRENIIPIRDAGLLDLIEGNKELLPPPPPAPPGEASEGVALRPAPLSLKRGEGEPRPVGREVRPNGGGVSVRVTGGHTRGHQIVFIESGGKKAVFWSDLIPTTAHLDLPYIMSYDLFPEETLEEKKHLVEQAISEKWLCFWEHDPVVNCGYIQRNEEGRPVVQPISEKP